MMPRPPLDGGRVAVGLLPDLLAAPLGPYGLPILIGLLFIAPMLGAQMGVDLSNVSRIVGIVTVTIISAIRSVLG
jgi:Zn-dependent protease